MSLRPGRGLLRAALWDLTGGVCEWPSCDEQADEMAHVEPSGMGGRSSVDTIENVMALCRGHHDVLDGRLPRAAFPAPSIERAEIKTSRAIRDLAAGYLRTRRSMLDPEWRSRPFTKPIETVIGPNGLMRIVEDGKVTGWAYDDNGADPRDLHAADAPTPAEEGDTP